MRNKRVLVITIVIIVLLAIGVLLFIPKDNNDNKTFEKDYEVNVPKNTSIIYLTDENVIKELSTNDKLVFFGNKNENYNKTKEGVTTLLKTAEENGIDKIYYYDLSGIENKREITDKLTEILEKEGLMSPTLFLVKNKKIDSIEEGINKDIEKNYKKIMIAYLMCSTPDC